MRNADRLKRGDIVELKENYISWAVRGTVGVVEKIREDGVNDVLVESNCLLKGSLCCYAFRLHKLGELE